MKDRTIRRMCRTMVGVLCLALASSLSAAVLRHAGRDMEMSLSLAGEHTIEVTLTPLGQSGVVAAGPSSTVLVGFSRDVKWRARDLAGPAEVAVGLLRCEITPSPLTLTVHRPDGTIAQKLVWNEDRGSLLFLTDTPVFGLGEGGPGFDRRGGFYPMKDGWGAVNRPIYGSRISVPFLLGANGWGMFLPDLPGQEGEFDLRGTQGVYNAGEKQSALALRVLLFVADEPAEILTEYTRLVGRAPMPPKWALGYMQSHRTLAGPEEVLGVARTFREKQLPCDALIYLGTGYCPAGWNTGHGSLESNPKTFDRPQEMIDRLHDQHFKIVLHVNHAPRGLYGGALMEESDDPLHIRNYWARHRPVYAMGADGWWPDDGDELPKEARLARHRCYYEGPLSDKPNLRPWSLHRTGYVGAGRYGGWIWTGDPESRWATLAAHVAIGLNHGVSLTPFWGSDTGGFIPTRELTGELYVRWFQFSAFCPSFRSHGRTWHLRLPWGWNTGKFGPIEEKQTPDASELHNAAVEPICRDYLNLRYRLLPYNYTLARESHDTGMPMMRALWLGYPQDSQAVACSDQYLWGREILVAPVVQKGASERSVYLPAGDWYDWWTGEKLAGGRTISRKVDLATLPLYVRAGAIIPLDPVRQYVNEPVTELTTVRVYPGADGRFTLYEDDGESLGYQRGQGTWTRMVWQDAAKRLVIDQDRSTDTMPRVSRAFWVTLAPSGTRRLVEFQGERTEIVLGE